MKEKVITYVQDIVREMKKVTWPTRQELAESTRIVIIVSLILSVFTWAVDVGISEILKLILR